MQNANEPAPLETPPTLRERLLKRIRRLLVIVLLTYIMVCVVVGVFQTRLIYYPSPEYDRAPSDIGLSYETLTLKTQDGESLSAWFVPNEEAKATILFCHGNAGNISDRLVSISLLHTLGYQTLIFDYRGYGHSTGQPSEKGTYLDAEAAWKSLTATRGVAPDRIVLFGRSLGGAVAIDLATRCQPAALVVESTFTRLADIARVHYPLLPGGLLLVHRYDSIAKVSTLTCPKLFLHGTDDELVPLTNARRLYEAAAPPKEFIETPGGHNAAGITYQDEFARQLAVFIDQAIAGRDRP